MLSRILYWKSPVAKRILLSLGFLIVVFYMAHVYVFFHHGVDKWTAFADLRSSPKRNVPAKADRISIDDWLEGVMSGKRKRPNVLFIIADDLRPEIQAQVHHSSPWLEPSMQTPHLDALAGSGILFRRAYCQFAWCNPSRSSFLTSRRPDTTLVHNNSVNFRQNNRAMVSLPQYFKQNGYFTMGMGKVFHLVPQVPGCEDNDYSWSVPMLRTDSDRFYPDGNRAWKAVTPEETDGKPILDELVTEFAKDALSKIAHEGLAGGKPFFLAVGIKKPHMNWYFPERFLHKYNLEDVSLPKPYTMSDSVPHIAWLKSYEVTGKEGYKEHLGDWTRSHKPPEWIIKELRRAYYSCVTYVDDLIGQILQHLQDVGLANNTIVAFVGDHGFHLGEHGIVGKNTAFEVANNSPLIFRIPGVTDHGIITDKLVELVDILPTLVDLAGLPHVPYCPGDTSAREVSLCTEGTSLLPLLQNPDTNQWKGSVFFQYPHISAKRGLYCMGYTIRTEKYRYTEWIVYFYQPKPSPQWQDSCGVEMYDVVADPFETNNLAEDERLEGIRRWLSQQLRAGWKAALPSR